MNSALCYLVNYSQGNYSLGHGMAFPVLHCCRLPNHEHAVVDCPGEVYLNLRPSIFIVESGPPSVISPNHRNRKILRYSVLSGENATSRYIPDVGHRSSASSNNSLESSRRRRWGLDTGGRHRGTTLLVHIGGTIRLLVFL